MSRARLLPPTPVVNIPPRVVLQLKIVGLSNPTHLHSISVVVVKDALVAVVSLICFPISTPLPVGPLERVTTLVLRFPKLIAWPLCSSHCSCCITVVKLRHPGSAPTAMGRMLAAMVGDGGFSIFPEPIELSVTDGIPPCQGSESCQNVRETKTVGRGVVSCVSFR